MRPQAEFWQFFNRATGECVAARVELANTARARLCGLIGRCGLSDGEALWLRPSSGVHTCGMRFAIDVVFLDRDLRIVKLVENLRPFRLTLPHLRAASVLEMGAHSITRAGLRVGDRLRAARKSEVGSRESEVGSRKSE
jgi:uncharacterized protein